MSTHIIIMWWERHHHAGRQGVGVHVRGLANQDMVREGAREAFPEGCCPCTVLKDK